MNDISYAFRDKFVDIQTPFLKLLNDSGLRQQNGQFDDIALWKKLKLTEGVAEEMQARFSSGVLREVMKVNRLMWNKYSNAGKTRSELSNLFSMTASFMHIPNATRLAREQLTKELADATEMNDEVGTDETAFALETIEAELLKFDLFQKDNGTGVARKKGVVQGGMTAIRAKAIITANITNLAKASNQPINEVKADFELMQRNYVGLAGWVRDFGVQRGLYSQEQVQEWDESGLSEDYIPLTGVDPDVKTISTVGSSLDMDVNKSRNGRFSIMDDAFTAITRRAVDVFSEAAARDFNLLLLSHARQGLIQGVEFANVNDPFRMSKLPMNARPIKVRDGDKQYAIWFTAKNGNEILESLRNYNEFRAGKILQGVANVTRFWFTISNTIQTPFCT